MSILQQMTSLFSSTKSLDAVSQESASSAGDLTPLGSLVSTPSPTTPTNQPFDSVSQDSAQNSSSPQGIGVRPRNPDPWCRLPQMMMLPLFIQFVQTCLMLLRIKSSQTDSEHARRRSLFREHLPAKEQTTSGWRDAEAGCCADRKPGSQAEVSGGAVAHAAGARRRAALSTAPIDRLARQCWGQPQERA